MTKRELDQPFFERMMFELKWIPKIAHVRRPCRSCTQDGGCVKCDRDDVRSPLDEHDQEKDIMDYDRRLEGEINGEESHICKDQCTARERETHRGLSNGWEVMTLTNKDYDQLVRTCPFQKTKNGVFTRAIPGPLL